VREKIEMVAMVVSAILFAASVIYAYEKGVSEQPKAGSVDREQEAVRENATETAQWQGITTQPDPLDVFEDISEDYDMLAPLRVERPDAERGEAA
jgi:hypothetical protein